MKGEPGTITVSLANKIKYILIRITIGLYITSISKNPASSLPSTSLISPTILPASSSLQDLTSSGMPLSLKFSHLRGGEGGGGSGV